MSMAPDGTVEATTMFELARYEGRHRVLGALALTAGLGLLAIMDIALYPSMSATVNFDDYLKALPPAVLQAFGITTMSTIQGFLSAELYAFGWVLLLGLYLAYSAAGLVADDVERGRMDVLLSLPVSRSRVVAEKYLSLLVPIAVLNVVTPVVVYVGTQLVGDPIPIADLLAVHALSIPYLLACAGLGLAASVVFDRASVAQRVAMAVLFALFLVQSMVTGTDYAWLGSPAPMRYYDPTAVLVQGEYDLAGAAILLVAALVLVVASQQWFRRRDV